MINSTHKIMQVSFIPSSFSLYNLHAIATSIYKKYK